MVGRCEPDVGSVVGSTSDVAARAAACFTPGSERTVEVACLADDAEQGDDGDECRDRRAASAPLPWRPRPRSQLPAQAGDPAVAPENLSRSRLRRAEAPPHRQTSRRRQTAPTIQRQKPCCRAQRSRGAGETEGWRSPAATRRRSQPSHCRTPTVAAVSSDERHGTTVISKRGAGRSRTAGASSAYRPNSTAVTAASPRIAAPAKATDRRSRRRSTRGRGASLPRSTSSCEVARTRVAMR